MRSLAEVRKHRVLVVGGGHPREGELRRLLDHADFEVVSFHRRGSQQELSLSEAMLDAELSPPPDAIVLAAGSVITTLRALEQHPVLRWVDPIVAPWAALDEGASTPLRIAQLLTHLQASDQDRQRVSRELANARRAVFQLAPLGPLPLLLAAARTKGTTLVLESGVGRARISLAHGRFVGGRATDAAQLRTVRGLEALAVALRIPEAEVLVVNDEEDEPIGELLDDALHAALAMEPAFEMSSSAFLRPAPRVVEPRRVDAEALRLPTKREPTLRIGKVAEDEPNTRLWHRPLAREWPESPSEKKQGTQRYGFPTGLSSQDASEEEVLDDAPPQEQAPSAERVHAQPISPSSEVLRTVLEAPRPALETTLVTPRQSEAAQTLPPPAPKRSLSLPLAAAASALAMAALVWLYVSPVHVEIASDTSSAAPFGVASHPTTLAVASTPSTPSAALFATPTPVLPSLLEPTEPAVATAMPSRRRSRRTRARAAVAHVPSEAPEAPSGMPTSVVAEGPSASTTSASAMSAPSSPAPSAPAPAPSAPAPSAPAHDPRVLMPPDSI